MYCEPAKVGRGKGWRLLVAIADVSHYVETGSAIDVDAYDRATSVYFPRRVIPMLPEKLSNGLCSLNPEVERLCMVCDMLVTATGEIYAYQFYPGVMWSHARFTYTEVAAILANTRGPEAMRRKDRVADLLNLHDVYRALLKARNQRGAVDFETIETQIICDESGRIERIVPRMRNDAHRLIEEAMLAANVCSADFIQQSKHPGLFRVHEGPTPEKKDMLRNYLKAIGVPLTISDDPLPAEFQRIAEATKERPDAQQIHTMLLRSMSAGDLHADQQRPLRPGLRRLHPFHQPDPALSRPAGAPRDQGDPGQRALRAAGAADAGRGAREAGAPLASRASRRRATS